MAQQIRLSGWHDPEHPARGEETAGLHEFRLQLSEVPQAPWKRVFTELGRDQKPGAGIEQDVLTLGCELTEIQNAVERIKQRVRSTNETLVRQEREANERIARQVLESERRRATILAAVKGIHFDDA